MACSLQCITLHTAPMLSEHYMPDDVPAPVSIVFSGRKLCPRRTCHPHWHSTLPLLWLQSQVMEVGEACPSSSSSSSNPPPYSTTTQASPHSPSKCPSIHPLRHQGYSRPHQAFRAETQACPRQPHDQARGTARCARKHSHCHFVVCLGRIAQPLLCICECERNFVASGLRSKQRKKRSSTLVLVVSMSVCFYGMFLCSCAYLYGRLFIIV